MREKNNRRLSVVWLDNVNNLYSGFMLNDPRADILTNLIETNMLSLL